MRMPFELAPREALAAPTAAWQAKIQSTAILVVSMLSILGAGWIMISFACFKSLRTFRHQLILGLAVSDFVMALNFLASASVGASGHDLGDASLKGFCSFNGFMTQVFVIQTDYWVLLIAFCTYLILADHKRLSSWIQDRRLLLACLPWLFSILWAAIGLVVTGYGNIGAWCWFTSDEVRLLVNFVPRWLIILLMLSMYARLYYVLRKAHRRFASFDRSSEPNSHPQSHNLEPPGSNAATGSGYRHTPQGNNKSSKRLKRLARLMIMYPVAYMLIWTLPTCIRIYQATQGKAAPFALQTVDKSCIVVQGLIDAIIYGLNESSLASWRNLLWPQAFPVVQGAHGPPEKTSRIPSARLGSRELDGSSTTLDLVATRDTEVLIHAAPEKQPHGDAVELAALPRAARGGLQIHKTVAVTVSTSRPGSDIVDRHRGREHMY
ncbi:hypothetical protein GQ53DRAFT_100010 [Thozetella sp. PMI_491]|nr:hypothetical protein GQ53DRAFT_100010 [Thozetella sp. PMI_491]